MGIELTELVRDGGIFSFLYEEELLISVARLYNLAAAS